MAMSLVSFDKSKSGVLQLPYEGRILAKEGQSSKKSRLQEQGKHKKDCACRNIHFHSFGVMLENGLGGYDWSDQAEEDLIMHSHGFTHLQVLTQRKSIVDQLQERLKGYNAVPPPYTGNFMPPTPDLSFTGLDEFVNKPVVENRKSDEEVSKVVRKSNDSLIIEDWVSDSEEENVSQTKTKKKTVKPSIAKIEFVKPKQQEKTARKTVKQVEKHRQNTHSPRGNQRNWNNMMSQRLGSNFEMFNKACYVCGSFDHLQMHKAHTGNMSSSSDYEEIEGGIRAFEGNLIGGKLQEKLQALVDGKKIIITESTVRRDRQLEDAEGVDCLPNSTIFEQLTLMGYEKISQKLTFYKAFFSQQWKFLVHTILQCLSSKTTAWNEFSSTMASTIICLATNQKFNTYPKHFLKLW
ncbi:hypothetical protein Tco_0407546 [Tanacetum coccineum]